MKTLFQTKAYRFINPSRSLASVRLDNIAIVPASMLPIRDSLQEILSDLPKGGVLLCHTRQNAKQKRILKRVEEDFRQQGHAVVNLPLERFRERQ
jgi:hypothetical protein